MEKLPPRMMSVAFSFAASPSGDELLTCDPAFRRQLKAFEWRLLTGDFSGVKEFYETVPPDSRCFLLAARQVLMGAVGSGETGLLARVVEDVRAYPTRCGLPFAQLGAELTEVWLRQHLHVADGYPDWFVDGRLQSVPSNWRFLVVYLMAKVFLLRHEYVKAQLIAQTALYLPPERSSSPLVQICQNFVLALALQGQGRVEESAMHFRVAVKVAAEHRVRLPFLMLSLGSKSAQFRAMKAEAPELLRSVKALAPTYFRNVVRAHNAFTGRQVTELLSAREFTVASSLLHGLRYKEIATCMGVEVSSVNGITKSIYSKLGIHGFSELAGKVW